MHTDLIVYGFDEAVYSPLNPPNQQTQVGYDGYYDSDGEYVRVEYSLRPDLTAVIVRHQAGQTEREVIRFPQWRAVLSRDRTCIPSRSGTAFERTGPAPLTVNQDGLLLIDGQWELDHQFGEFGLIRPGCFELNRSYVRPGDEVEVVSYDFPIVGRRFIVRNRPAWNMIGGRKIFSAEPIGEPIPDTFRVSIPSVLGAPLLPGEFRLIPGKGEELLVAWSEEGAVHTAPVCIKA